MKEENSCFLKIYKSLLFLIGLGSHFWEIGMDIYE